MIVMKFGGSSITPAGRMHRVFRIVKENLARRPVLVVSALAGITDLLETSAQRTVAGGKISLSRIRQKHLAFAKQLGLSTAIIEPLLKELEQTFRKISFLRELTPRTLDYVLSFGERMSARLVAGYLNRQNIPAVALDADKLGLVTNSDFGNAHPLPESERIIAKRLRGIKAVPVITGFIGRNKQGRVTTLGRNGSDYTASFIGAALGSREIQIWREVDGVMTADPKIVKKARSVERITLNEASELAHYGGGVLHPYMLAPAVRKKIPIRVLNIFKPASAGTVIADTRHTLNQKRFRASKTQDVVKSIAYKKDTSLINIVSPEIFHHRGLVGRVFDILQRHRIVVHIIASSEISISLSTDRITLVLKEALREIAKFARVNLKPARAIICVIGEGIREAIGIAADALGALKRARINVEMISHGATRTNITLIVGNRDATRAVRALHQVFFG